MTALFPVRLEAAEMRQRGRVLVGPIDLELTGAGTTVIIGPNGAGKTSLLRLMHGLGRLRSGSLTWACSTDEAQHQQAFVFQSPIIMRRSVRDNIAYPLQLRGQPRREARRAAEALAERVGLAEVLGGRKAKTRPGPRADSEAIGPVSRRALRGARRSCDARNREHSAG